MASSYLKHIIQFFLRLLLIVSVIFVCDKGIGTILKHFYFRQESGAGYRSTYVIDSTFADILIFGSSRANHCYDPEIFEDSLHYTCYNAGRDGSYILYTYAMFKAVTRRYNPKLIIIDIRPEDLNYNSFEYDRLSLLLPYYQKHPEISRIIDFRGPFEKIKLISAIYPYNSLILQILIGNLEYNKDRVTDIKGYLPYFNIMKNERIGTLQIGSFTIDENKNRALKDIISTCKQKRIDLVFVYSPVWSICQSGYSRAISELCSKNGIRFIDLSNYPTFLNHPEYFNDWDHLNNDGVRVFSSILTNKIIHTN